MVIRNLNVQNKFINFTNISLDFSSVGIYLISGKNGCGKTSIIEKIIFGDYNVDFINKEHYELFHKNRGCLFAYVEQDIAGYQTKLYDYIKKNNETLEDSIIKYWVDLMYPDGIDLEQSFISLSGGEKKKAAIISAILKDTPYIIFDEPTNSLDDKSVQILNKVLSDLSKEKTIIIISHDKRLNCPIFCRINIEDNLLFAFTEKEIKQNRYKTRNNNKKIFKVLTDAVQPTKQLPFSALTLIFVLLISLVNQWIFALMFSTEELPPPNMICIYTVDQAYGDLNRKYAEAEKLNVSEKNYYKMLSYSDIDKIKQTNGVSEIYLWDVELFYSFFEKFSNSENLINDFFIFAIPQSILSQEVVFSHFGFQEIKYLEKGRLPEDYKKEVSISKKLLMDKYGFTSHEADNAIGKKININDNYYEIVGIQYIDICVISFDKETSHGVYTYDKETYESFKSKTLDFINAANLSNKNISTGLIVTENGKESIVLNDLIKEYPAHNYYSNHFVYVFKTQNNENFIVAITILNSIVGLVIGFSIMFAKKKHSMLLNNRIRDYGNYYIARKEIKKFNTLLVLFENVFCMLIGVLMVYLFSLKTMIFSESVFVIIYTFILVCFPSTIMTLVKNKC